MITPSKEFWKIFKETDGALSCSEAVAIMNIAAQAPEGTWMELGTHKGKSAMAAIFSNEPSTLFFLIDPEFGKTINAYNVIQGILKASNREDKLVWMDAFSTDVIEKFNGYSYVFIDSGSHQDGLPMQEVRLLEDKMVKGGIIVFHDWDSQFVEVKQASDYLVGTGKYEYISIDWELIIKYVNENNLEEGNKSWHHNELRNPCFVGAVRRK
jgi:hypothetical protein